jgi:hypothetical protein
MSLALTLSKIFPYFSLKIMCQTKSILNSQNLFFFLFELAQKSSCFDSKDTQKEIIINFYIFKFLIFFMRRFE